MISSQGMLDSSNRKRRNQKIVFKFVFFVINLFIVNFLPPLKEIHFSSVFIGLLILDWLVTNQELSGESNNGVVSSTSLSDVTCTRFGSR